MDSVRIRPATLADAAAITDVHCSTVTTWRDPADRQPTTYEALDLFGRWYNGGPWMSLELCAIHLNHMLLAGHLPLIAEVEDAVVGEAEYVVNPEPSPYGPSLHLSVLYIHRAWQQLGIGRALIEAGAARAQALGLKLLSVQPEPDSRAFYRRVGFAPWLEAQEVRFEGDSAVPKSLTRQRRETAMPGRLALRVGRYQCGVLAWWRLWPRLALPGVLSLHSSAWTGTLGDTPVVLGLRGHVGDPTLGIGSAWLPPTAPLMPAVRALQALSAAQGFHRVNLLLPKDFLAATPDMTPLDASAVELWRRNIARA
jgi:GNAT superfamily N-acetyltransferase